MTLTESYCPADRSAPVEEVTVGEALRLAARRQPDAEALVECDVRGALGRRWTYSSLLADAERLAEALLSRYAAGERICV